MNVRNVHIPRYTLPALAASAVLAFTGALALGGAPAASARSVDAQLAASENWAGYVVKSNTGTQQFSSVSGSWVQPTIKSSSSTGPGYSAFWVGLGGSSGQSQALEQVGTSADWVNGQAVYYAWYELVPAPETKLSLTIHPGDHISARVSVSGQTVTVSLSDQTTGQSATKTVQTSTADTSSAEWIAEAPSTYGQGGNYQTLPLANFGQVAFTGASATSNGHTGSISDPNWTVQQVQLSTSGNTGRFAGGGAGFAGTDPGLASAQSASGAQTSSLSSDGASFSVNWTSDSSQVSSSSSAGGTAGSASGYGDGYGPGGYGYSYGYVPGYGYGYVPGYSYSPDGYGY
jgi:Peptidase A4 family